MSSAAKLFCICTLFFSVLHGQNSSFTGTFITPNGAVGLQLKAVGSELHGLLVSTEGMYALKAENTATTINGTVFTNIGNYNFSGQAIQGGLNLVSEGVNYTFYQTSTQHELDAMDLTPYFTDGTATSTEETTDSPTSKDMNYTGEAKELFNYIAGSQLVFYQRTSIFNDSTASSITYVNFCADGRFSLNYDGGFSVEGRYGGNAHGVTRGKNYGTWHLERRQGAMVGVLNFADGTQSVYTINKNYLAQGRWRIGNTQYALARNKAVCR
ncbi:hypothetical protein L0P88_22060 [Muricauda sp. SCSIO 64092]|uniref:hypothetical protein n=1 Tax=Allomuricauda sp. SCSIO 64092 TaxID=2908842 RepID=UPI001FF2CC00|nr:hypothetical protein [Muricauda sp. SCSIO 64092]UOY06594.1 hypothetical protein L0P88_22060 [Muricauda sp. SCSIO 64092]